MTVWFEHRIIPMVQFSELPGTFEEYACAEGEEDFFRVMIFDEWLGDFPTKPEALEMISFFNNKFGPFLAEFSELQIKEIVAAEHHRILLEKAENEKAREALKR